MRVGEAHERAEHLVAGVLTGLALAADGREDLEAEAVADLVRGHDPVLEAAQRHRQQGAEQQTADEGGAGVAGRVGGVGDDTGVELQVLQLVGALALEVADLPLERTHLALIIGALGG